MHKDEKREQLQMGLESGKQRADFQRQCVLLNIVSIGSISSFGLSNPDKIAVLFAIPAISFLLFCFWYHNAFVILDIELYARRLLGASYRQGVGIGQVQDILLKISYMVGQFAHFALSGLLVLWYFREEPALKEHFPDRLPPFELLWWGDLVLCTIVVAGLLNWHIMYYRVSGITHVWKKTADTGPDQRESGLTAP